MTARPKEIAATVERKKKPLIERFMRLFEPEPNTGCWLWKGRINNPGYGVMKIRHKYVTAHRLAWTLLIGEVPEGMLVLHRCDNPPCCNPDHLFIGSRQDNMSDMAMKGRGRRSVSGLPFGVSRSRDVPSKPYRANVKFMGKTKFCGYFETPEEAGVAALARKAELYSGGFNAQR